MGIVSGADGEWAIVGGTRKLSMARGTVKFTTVQNSPNIESYKKIDIHAFYTTQPTVSIINLSTKSNHGLYVFTSSWVIRFM